ncbi:MAG: nuclear transport factor 2 family protein [Defluviitaleaceae bacterium]|nr:nuclear transport factor 2 family protein [Defluviitaleaceae bacterium]
MSAIDMKEIVNILSKLQKGYDEKNPENAAKLMTEIFSDRSDLLALGTGSWEVFLGRDEVTKLIHDDWDGGWGDFKIDIAGAKIEVDGDMAWFFANSTVKYAFQDGDDAKYLDFMKKIMAKQNESPKKRLAFFNWVLAVHFHERKPGKREYLWPSELSGMLVKENGAWRMATLHFTVDKSNYPDERFEAFADDYQAGHIHTKNKILAYNRNKADDKLRHLLKQLEREMADDAELGGLQFDPKQVLAFDAGQFAWVVALGTVKQSISEDEIFDRSLQEIEKLLDTDLPSEDKLFQAKRSMASALKEAASGAGFTWPIRLTAVIEKDGDEWRFRHKHFSYPFYWVFEGKLD